MFAASRINSQPAAYRTGVLCSLLLGSDCIYRTHVLSAWYGVRVCGVWGVKIKLRTDTVGNRGVVISGESGGEYTHSRNFIGKMSKNCQAMNISICYNV